MCDRHFKDINPNMKIESTTTSDKVSAVALSDGLSATQAEEDKHFDEQAAKCGNYDNPENGCPKCGRQRVMLGADKKHRCEKCAWCIEDNDYDGDFFRHLR